MYIKGHGIEKQQTERLYSAAREFFSLPEQIKQAVSIQKSDGYRGWSPIGSEKLEKGLPADLKESFDVGDDRPSDHPDSKFGNPFYCANLYPETPGLRSATESYFGDLLSVALKIMQAMALALDQKQDFFDQYFDHSTSILRMLHYLPAEHKSHPDQPGAGAHTDYGCLTILSQDDVGGLQIKHMNGQWIDAPPLDGCFVVNVGDMMCRWTNGEYKSTLHRVTGDLKSDRYSVPFFVEPNYDTVVQVLQSCIKPGMQAKYPPVISGEWL
ncbi:MAG: isopenicillin N synthase family oxygenase, partial [Sneathiella sp.]|nr:isopenicillin N synthase family oxygenase [Sneathiella sp.]